MSNRYNRAGKSTREMADKRWFAMLWIGLIAIIVLIVICVLLQNPNKYAISGGGVLALIILAAIIRNVAEGQIDRKYREEKRATRGARAEEKIGEILDSLDDNYYVLNDIENPCGNIDHIVISKFNGIFLIETKAHGGKVDVSNGMLLVNGKLPEKDFVAQALGNTYWLRDKVKSITGLTVWITPVIVFTNAFVPPVPPIKNVSIINKRYLASVLQRQGRQNIANSQVWEQRGKIGLTLTTG